jgi:hypothetical protein
MISMDKSSNLTLEKYRLIAEHSEGKIPDGELGKRLLEIDYLHRDSDSKTIEAIFRKGGKGLMLAGLLSLIPNISLTAYQNYQQSMNGAHQSSSESDARNYWMMGSVLLAYLGSGLYNLRRKEWDQFEKDSF